MGKSNDVPPALEVTGERIEGIVVWYSAKKGMGFISVEGYQNIYVNVDVVRQAGISALREQDKVSFVLAYDKVKPKRTFASELLMIETKSEAEATRPKSRLQGRILWFKRFKGYGFIKPENGGPNMFIGDGDVPVDALPLLREGVPVSYIEQLDRDGRTRATHLLIVKPT